MAHAGGKIRRSARAWYPYLPVLLTCVFSVGEAEGYLKQHPSYDAMFEGSDLVVIATPILRRELDEPAVLPGVRSGGKTIDAVPIETTFRSIVTFKTKPDYDDSTFVFIHYRRSERPQVAITAGPALVDFEPSDGARYLMFLKALADGRFEAFTRADPGDSIEKLKKATKP